VKYYNKEWSLKEVDERKYEIPGLTSFVSI